jgi:membrane fusion protein, copper/silver efflux system
VSTENPLSRWNRWKLLVKVIEVRLRFVVVLVLTALLIGYWDWIKNHWDKWTRPAAAGVAASQREYFCPMHPKVIRHELEPDGSIPKCPICGMPLSPRSAQAEGEPLPPGVTARVQISPERIELAGIQTVAVGYRLFQRHIDTVGTVAYDESRLARIVTRTAGYVEKLYVDRTYVEVKRGDPLVEIYSPDLYSTSQELLLAAKDPAAADMVVSARRRLTLFGVSPAEIDAMLAAGRAMPRLVIRSPRSGLVTGKNVVAGARVDEGMTLLEVADLSQVWIEADVYEHDIALVAAGQAVTARVEAWPQQTFAGKVALVYPQLDAATRTNRVRFQVDNPAGRLRPGMFATVEIAVPAAGQQKHGGAADMLAVPQRAVIDTGTKQIVYVQRKPGTFEGVEVQLGPSDGDYYPVLKGLAVGERIAAAGAFLIDAETRLNPAAAAMYFGASGGPSTAVNRNAASEHAASAPEIKVKSFTAAQLANLAKLSAGDRKMAMAQGACPVTGAMLGSMGVPVKIVLQGQSVFLCCSGCVDEARTKPQETLAKVAQLKAAYRAAEGKNP